VFRVRGFVSLGSVSQLFDAWGYPLMEKERIAIASGISFQTANIAYVEMILFWKAAPLMGQEKISDRKIFRNINLYNILFITEDITLETIGICFQIVSQ
jgi:hypothetical protein